MPIDSATDIGFEFKMTLMSEEPHCKKKKQRSIATFFIRKNRQKLRVIVKRDVKLFHRGRQMYFREDAYIRDYNHSAGSG